MQEIKKYKKIVFHGITELDFVRAYASVFGLERSPKQGTIHCIENIWDESARDVLHHMEISYGNFIHITAYTHRQVSYHPNTLSVVIDCHQYPSIYFASKWIVELGGICDVIKVEYVEYEEN